MKPIEVLVVGGGPAGLAAAARLLEKAAGRVRVTLVHMGHLLGGKAVSVRRDDGFIDEHGWHMVVGFYRNMRGLMQRAGVDPSAALVSMQHQSHCFEPSTRRISTMSSGGGKIEVAARFAGYDGLPFEERLNFGRFMAQAFAVATSGEPLAKHDDICFDTWAVERGLRRHITHYSIFRFLRLAYFNFPEQISAYHILQTLRFMSTSEDAELFVARGGYTDLVWSPIGRYIERLGARIVPGTVLLDWIYEGDRITGARTAKVKSDPARLSPAADERGAVLVEPESETTLAGFDCVLSTIPVAQLVTMNKADARMWASPYFRRWQNIRSAATMGLTILTNKPVAPQFRGPLHGFPSPFNFVVDMKPYWPDLRARPDVGSVLVFGGQEAGFETWTDEQIVEFTLESYAASGEIGDIAKAGILRTELRRNRAPFERLMISEPGIEPFRPGPRTPFRNWFVAGDWVRNSVSVISMEGAVASGIESADELLASPEGI